eukprot:15450475-Alexandrium_andersonii.AAC.1
MPWCFCGIKWYPIGEALNPGPADGVAEDMCVLQTLNITSFPKYLPEIMQHSVDFMFLQEHTMKQSKAHALAGMVAQAGGCLVAGPVTEALDKPTGGIACYAPKKRAVLEVLPETEDLREVRAAGRYGSYFAPTPSGRPIRVFVVYCWTGAAERLQARAKNRELLRAVLAEMDTTNLPSVLCGDFNADWQVYPELSEAVHSRRLFD